MPSIVRPQHSGRFGCFTLSTCHVLCWTAVSFWRSIHVHHALDVLFVGRPTRGLLHVPQLRDCVLCAVVCCVLCTVSVSVPVSVCLSCCVYRMRRTLLQPAMCRATSRCNDEQQKRKKSRSTDACTTHAQTWTCTPLKHHFTPHHVTSHRTHQHVT